MYINVLVQIHSTNISQMVIESWFFEENLLISLENGLVEDASLKLPNSTQIQAKLYPTFITQQLQEIETWFQKQK